MKLSGLQLAQGEVAPWWYGVAYYSPYSDHVFCYPVPINLIVRASLWAWWQLRRGKPDALAQAYQRGKADSRKLTEAQAIDLLLQASQTKQE